MTTNTFQFLGVPAGGSAAASCPSDAKPGAPPVFVMAYKMWAKFFNLDPSIVGRTFVLERRRDDAGRHHAAAVHEARRGPVAAGRDDARQSGAH